MFITFNSHRGDHLLGKTIRFFSRGQFNHTSINLNGVIYEAHINTGVRRINADDWTDKTIKSSTTFNIDVHTHRSLKYWLDKQVGKKYDLWGVLSFIWRFAKPNKRKWFCSELAVVVLAKLFYIQTYNQRQSPSDFYYLVQAIESVATGK